MKKSIHFILACAALAAPIALSANTPIFGAQAGVYAGLKGPQSAAIKDALDKGDAKALEKAISDEIQKAASKAKSGAVEATIKSTAKELIEAIKAYAPNNKSAIQVATTGSVMGAIAVAAKKGDTNLKVVLANAASSGALAGAPKSKEAIKNGVIAAANTDPELVPSREGGNNSKELSIRVRVAKGDEVGKEFRYKKAKLTPAQPKKKTPPPFVLTVEKPNSGDMAEKTDNAQTNGSI